VAVLKKIQTKSDWKIYQLETEFLEPPEFKVRLRFLNPFDLAADIATSSVDPRQIIKLASEAILEWELTDENGKEIPPTSENKIDVLRQIGGEMVVSSSIPLALAIVNDAKSADFFLKASPGSVSGIKTGV